MKAFFRKHVHVICAMILIGVLQAVFDPAWYVIFPLSLMSGMLSGRLMAYDEARAKVKK